MNIGDYDPGKVPSLPVRTILSQTTPNENPTQLINFDSGPSPLRMNSKNFGLSTIRLTAPHPDALIASLTARAATLDQVNAIVTGWIETDMTAHVKTMPLNQEIIFTGPAVFLASPILSPAIFVDGGYAIREHPQAAKRIYQRVSWLILATSFVPLSDTRITALFSPSRYIRYAIRNKIIEA
jgi:hypothetical protein